MTVRVRLYAGIRERAGTDRLHVEGSDIDSVRAAIAEACPAIAASLSFCRFALDDEFVDSNAAVADGATVDVIPPVSGG